MFVASLASDSLKYIGYGFFKNIVYRGVEISKEMGQTKVHCRKYGRENCNLSREGTRNILVLTEFLCLLKFQQWVNTKGLIKDLYRG